MEVVSVITHEVLPLRFLSSLDSVLCLPRPLSSQSYGMHQSLNYFFGHHVEGKINTHSKLGLNVEIDDVTHEPRG